MKYRNLPPGQYVIPSDCKANIAAGIVTVSPRLKLSGRHPRCSSCRHFAQGYATAGGRVTTVCKLRPKHITSLITSVPSGQIYYATLPKRKTCPDYAPRLRDITDSSDFHP